jgi:peptidoglycan hydrolase-like protein with peptidoglycan-binding domain
MRIRYSTWSMTAVLLVASAAVGYAAAPNSDAANSSAAKPAASAKKPSATPVHSTAKRRIVARHAVVAHAQMAPTASRISEIQAALANNGAYQGMPNGRWDAATIDAMRHFQNQHDLNPTGKIDALTLQKLGLGSQVAGMGAPVPVAVPQASAADKGEQTERP